MHNNYLTICAFFIIPLSASIAQTDPDLSRKEVEEKAMKAKLVDDLPDSLKNWKTGATLNSNVTNTGLVNWQGGGQPALTITGIFLGSFDVAFKFNQNKLAYDSSIGIAPDFEVVSSFNSNDEYLRIIAS